MSFLKSGKHRKILLQISAGLIFVSWLAGFHSCANKAYIAPLPQSPWGGKYAYSYDVPSDGKAKSVPIIVAVVNPSYREDKESLLANDIFSKVGKGFSSSMGTDLDKILISKGINTTGPFASLDEITYSQKKEASLTLASQVFISAEMKPVGQEQYSGGYMMQTYDMSINGWISFNMQEPLSGQKMWIKKIELEPIQVQTVVYTEAIPRYGNDGCGGTMVVGYNRGSIVYDGRVDSIADALKQMYPVILSKFQKFIDPEELIALKEKGKEIRSSGTFGLK
ncbi:MAG: hypothetical protein Fur0012_05140 [Elusimicrobiota bacterium]